MRSGSACPRVAALAGVVFGLALLASAPLGCSLRATHGDYDAYRSYRLADDQSARALAGATYLERYPEGVYAEEVRAALGAEEERFYAVRASSAAGLRDYLRVYPTGRHAAAAHAELQALSRRDAEDAAAVTRAREASEAAAAAALRAHRGFTRERLDLFLGVLLRVDTWGQPMEQVVQAHPELDRAFAADPRPVCDATRCTKTLRVSFALPTDEGGVVERVSQVVVVLTLDDERLLGAEVWLPGFGFSRWYELETRTAVDDEDPEARRAATSWALAEIAPMLQAALGESFTAGARPPLASTRGDVPLLVLDAGGLSVDVVVAADGAAGGVDGFVIGPRASAP